MRVRVYGRVELGVFMEMEPAFPVFPDGLFPDPPGMPEAVPPNHSDPSEQLPATQSAFIETFRQIIDSLPEQIALVDDQWMILAANPAWMGTAALYGYDELKPGTNYFRFCRAKAAEGHAAAAKVAEGIEEMERTGQPTFRFTYHGSDRW